MNYNWEGIYKSKTDSELIKIFKGDKLLNTDAMISAAKILLERNYDSEKLNKIKEKHIEKLDFEINNIIKTDIEKEKRKNTIWKIILSSVWIILIYFFIRPEIGFDSIIETKQILFFGSFILIILATIIGIKTFKRHYIKELEKNLRAKKKIKETINQVIKI